MNQIKIRRMERIFKGGANHYRIKLLLLIEKNPGITLSSLVENLKADFKVIAQHLQKLSVYGLVYKKYQGKNVVHTLTPYGQKLVNIITSF